MNLSGLASGEGGQARTMCHDSLHTRVSGALRHGVPINVLLVDKAATDKLRQRHAVGKRGKIGNGSDLA